MYPECTQKFHVKLLTAVEYISGNRKQNITLPRKYISSDDISKVTLPLSLANLFKTQKVTASTPKTNADVFLN